MIERLSQRLQHELAFRQKREAACLGRSCCELRSPLLRPSLNIWRISTFVWESGDSGTGGGDGLGAKCGRNEEVSPGVCFCWQLVEVCFDGKAKDTGPWFVDSQIWRHPNLKLSAAVL